MALSEHEQRLLDEMERNLYGNDADVVSTTLANMPRPNYRAIVVGVLVALLGVTLLIGGVMSHIIALGILGFVVMFAGVLVAAKPGAKVDSSERPQKKRSASTFMQRMEQRWDERDQGRL